MANSRQRRIRGNEQQFKAFNEAIRLGRPDTGPKLQVVCECGRLDCDQRLDISDEEWREAHTHPGCYVIAVGHELPDIEDVVATNERYAVVEKHVD